MDTGILIISLTSAVTLGIQIGKTLYGNNQDDVDYNLFDDDEANHEW